MKNQAKSGQHDRGDATQDPREEKAIRGLLSLGHAFFNQHKADSADEKENKRIERIWIRRGAKAGIIYTGVTIIIMIAALGQLWVSRSSERNQLRAYAGIVAHSITAQCDLCSKPNPPASRTDPGDLRNSISFEVKNFGMTPALRPRMCADMPRFDAEHPPPRDLRGLWSFTTKCQDGAAGEPIIVSPTIWPSEGRPWQAWIKSPKDLADARADKASVYFVGRIRYEDAFGETHNTYFCFLYTYYAPPLDRNAFEGCNGMTAPEDN